MTGTMWAVAGALAAVCLGGALLPLARKWSQAGLHLFIAVAVGIFLGTLFLHLMPELAEGRAHGAEPEHAMHNHHAEELSSPSAAEATVEAAEHSAGSREPWVAALCGLLTLFLIEKIWLQGKSHLHAHGAVPANGTNLKVPEHGHEHGHNHGHEHGHDHGPAHLHHHQAEQTEAQVHAARPAAAPSESGSQAAPDHPPGEHCDHDPHSHDVGHSRERHALVWYASFLGLTIHAMLDGLNTSAVLVAGTIPWPFLLSMLVHKASEGFSLATVIRLGGVPVRRTFGFLTIFSLMSPLGMVAGGLLAEKLGAAHLGILRGFAAGSFLYVAVYDLLPEVFHDAKQRLLRCSAVAVGILIVAVSVVYTH